MSSLSSWLIAHPNMLCTIFKICVVKRNNIAATLYQLPQFGKVLAVQVFWRFRNLLSQQYCLLEYKEYC
jgi:hypothetical protein